MRIGFHASHEQFAPSQMLEYTIAAEQAGFDPLNREWSAGFRSGVKV